MKTCTWHRDGTPVYAQRPENCLRWYVPGCEVCAAKFVGLDTSATVTPGVLAKSLKGPRIDWPKRHSMQALKASKYPARGSTRAA